MVGAEPKGGSDALHLAKKIMATVGTPREGRYTDERLGAALRRYSRSGESRRAEAYWNYLMSRPWVRKTLAELHPERKAP